MLHHKAVHQHFTWTDMEQFYSLPLFFWLYRMFLSCIVSSGRYNMLCWAQQARLELCPCKTVQHVMLLTLEGEVFAPLSYDINLFGLTGTAPQRVTSHCWGLLLLVFAITDSFLWFAGFVVEQSRNLISQDHSGVVQLGPNSLYIVVPRWKTLTRSE